MAPLINVLDRCRISPPPPAASAAAHPTLPLTFFDLVFLPFPPVQRLFFYDFPHSPSHFLTSELPKLKHSLSLTLARFHPLAGRLLLSGKKPEIRCSNADSVALTVAASGDDIYELAGNHARDAARFHPLVPPLADEAVLSVQVTVFPDSGISIGTTLHHAAGDGSTYTHFMKTWASVCRLGDLSTTIPLPFYDRTVIRDPKGRLHEIFIEQLACLKDDPSLKSWDISGRADVVRATFTFNRVLLENLIDNAMRKSPTPTPTRCSPYAAACGYVWSCLVKAREETSRKTEKFGFVHGCRARLDPPAPAEYFGNCIGISCVEAKREELGAAGAAAAIWAAVKRLEDKGGGAFRRAGEWVGEVHRYAAAGAVTVAGSPKLGVYGVDFGWGRPRKVEVVSIERTGAVSLAEAAEEGGIEVGLALPRREMEAFVSAFVHGLSDIS